MVLPFALRRLLLPLVLALCAAAPASAFTARVCNQGDADLILAVAGETGMGGWSVEGWYPVAPGRCWSRGSSWEYQFLFSLRYRDATGKMGYGNFAPKAEFGKRQLAQPSNRQLCVDLRDPFTNRGSLSSLARCKPGQELAPFSIHVSGTANQEFTLNVPTRKAALHGGGSGAEAPAAEKPDHDPLMLACYDGDADACMTAALRGRDARWAYPQACLHGNAEGCLAGARRLRDGPSKNDSITRSINRLFGRGCVLGNQAACDEGAAYLGPFKGDKPVDPLLTMLALGCDPEMGGIARQVCWSLAEIMEDPSVAKGAYSNADALTFAAQLREKLCETPKVGDTCGP